MRVNARLDEEQTGRLDELSRRTGLSRSDVLREAVRRYYETVVGREGGSTAAALLASGFVGCAEGPGDLSTRYKDDLAELLAAKHGTSAV